MYLPRHFEQHDPQALHALVRQHPLGTLITLDAQGNPVANALPFSLDESVQPQGRLLTHVARANPLWREHPADREALVVFQGPNAYITPSAYPGKAEHGRVVPTWNYAVVQVRGLIRVMAPESPETREVLHRLTTEHEATQDAPWQMADAPADYLAAMMKALVALEIVPSAWSGKFKLSQNQPQANREGVLRKLADHPVAGMMSAWPVHPPESNR